MEEQEQKTANAIVAAALNVFTQKNRLTLIRVKSGTALSKTN